MKTIYAAIILILISIAQSVYAVDNEYKVIKVIDGDTVYVDFNKNGIPEKDEKVRLNGIDTFETKLNKNIYWQMRDYNLTLDEAFGLGYYGKEFAKKELLNKIVIVKYTAQRKYDNTGRRLMSIYYGCKNGKCKSYEEEVLKAGYAVVYKYSNEKENLKPYENIDKIKACAKKSHRLNLVILNKNTKKYHKTDCEYAQNMADAELIKKPAIKYKKALCCHFKKHFDIEKPKPDIHTKSIDIYFQSPLKYKKPANYARTSAAQRLLNDILNAKESIEFSIYGIGEQPEIFNAIVNAKKRGLFVSGSTDMDKDNKNEYPDTDKLINVLGKDCIKTDYLYTKKAEEQREKYINEHLKTNKEYKGFTEKMSYSLNNKNIDFEITSKDVLSVQQGIMHNKIFVIDKQIVWTGSANISSRGTGGYNANVMARIDNKNVALLYSQELEQMNIKGLFHQAKDEIKNNKNIKIDDETEVCVYFLPKHQPVEDEIRPLLQNARTRIYIPMFYLTHSDIIKDLISAKKERNIDVVVILDASGAQNLYTKHHLLRQVGIPVYVENWGGKMHMKSAVIDDVFVLGSMNWTKAGTTNNDENVIVIKNKKIADKSAEYFKHLQKSIPEKWLKSDPLPEGTDSKNSCFDGIDNDHDGLTDSKSPYCKNCSYK